MYQHRYVFKLGLRKAFLEEMQQLTESGLLYLVRGQTGSPRHSSSDSVSPSAVPKEPEAPSSSSQEAVEKHLPFSFSFQLFFFLMTL